MSDLSFQEDRRFAWPQTTLKCVNRRSPFHAGTPSACSRIGGVALRYSHESQTYVIDGRGKTDADAKSKARNTIRSHYRWVRQDSKPPPNHKEVDRGVSLVTTQPVQQASRWNITQIKKIRNFAAMRRTRITPTSYVAKKSKVAVTESNFSIMCGKEEEMERERDKLIDEDKPLLITIVVSSSNDSKPEESSSSKLHEGSSKQANMSVECKKETKAKETGKLSDEDKSISVSKLVSKVRHPEDSSTSCNKLHQDSSNEAKNEVEKKTTGTNKSINKDKPTEISTPKSNSQDNRRDESSTACVLHPTQSQQQNLQYNRSFSEESSLTDDSPNCIATDISRYKRPDGKIIINGIGIVKKNENKKGTVTWWDGRNNTCKPSKKETDAMVRGGKEPSSYPDKVSNADEISSDLNDNETTTSSLFASNASKYFTGEFWLDKNEKLKMQGGKVRRQVDEAFDKVKIMAADLSQCVDQVSCGMDEKKVSESIEKIECDGVEMTLEESAIHQELMNVPVAEVTVKGARKNKSMLL